ncbi:non-specific lipid-transfer protein C, cotyledon-specific isoform-like [Mangifera indica]|uniref:non-specific lipid-transfer protein C, cotyledon-specific isoform-like n=1 Tax=Mangifera indica TaxID=29780 RepID=UPI001CF9D5D0|nr:non-specific lipid-transfer protein C, cotyledon-specific isoform-like [Mangifera indica]
MKKNLFFSLLALLLVLFLIAHVGEAAISCDTVVSKSTACVAYATGKAPSPGNACCSGLQQLAQLARTVNDKKDICRCLKSAAKSMKVNDAYLSKIPRLCKINVGFSVSSKTNCETIH